MSMELYLERIDSLKARNEELATENRRLKEALEDYAEPKHWTWDGHAGHDVCVWNPMGDGYARAKEALEGKV